MEKPNLFIVGAAKSGTTALANYISQSGDVFLGEYKEPHFFLPSNIKSKIPFSIKTWEEYLKNYKKCGGEKYILDASVLYLPFWHEVIPKIKMNCDDAKIIILLRDPLQRAISAYKHSKRFNSEETKGFAEAVLDGPNRINENPMVRYLFLSQYVEPVSQYRKHFSNVLVLTSKEFSSDTQGCIDRLCDFLEIPRYLINFNIDDNSEGFKWKHDFVSRFVNTIANGKIRHKLRKMNPVFYRVLKKSCIDLFGGGEDKVSNEDVERVKPAFEKEKLMVAKSLGIKF